MDQRSKKAAYDRERKVLTAERKRNRRAEQDVIDKKLQSAFTVEENIERTREWWGKP